MKVSEGDLAGIAGKKYLSFLRLGLVLSSCSAIVLPLFHNSHSGFHADRIGAAPHLLLGSQQGSEKWKALA